jgi:DNA ligase D-like protein (predicted 3'-phosphoesterase)
MTRSKFIIVKHEAKRAGLHYDLRFIMPKSKIWASFAVRKGVPTQPGTKVLAVRTHDHTDEEALFLGTIQTGYGAGKLTKWDDGNCIIRKYTPSHISIEFQGRKVKGLYHMINTGVMNKKDYKKRSFMLFKGKEPIEEAMGMISLIPRGGMVEDTEESQDELESTPLPWGSTEKVTGPKSSLINRR